MRPTVRLPDLTVTLSQHEVSISSAVAEAMEDAGVGLLEDLREDVRRAGLGVRLANTWRMNVYPERGRPSLDPAAFIFSKAPKLIAVYMRGAVIVPVNGQRRLAIPTNNVPMKGRGRRMTPLDVETSFNQDLILRPSRKGDAILAFVNAVAAKNKKGWRAPTKGRAVQGRQQKLVLMFVLVRQVTVHGRLEDIQAVAERWAARLPELIADHWR